MMLESKQPQPIRIHLSLIQPSSKYLGFIQRNKKTDDLIKLKYFLYSRSKVHFISVSLEHVLGT